MNELTNCKIEALREDGEFVVSRVRWGEDLSPSLLFSPALERPAPASLLVIIILLGMISNWQVFGQSVQPPPPGNPASPVKNASASTAGATGKPAKTAPTTAPDKTASNTASTKTPITTLAPIVVTASTARPSHR